jgi:RNA recognition motif-containing protein
MTAWLVVDHLPCHFFDEELAALVRPFGRVLFAQIMRDRAGDQLGFGYVEVDTLEHAQCAICALNGHEIHGRTITVGLVQDPRSAPTA